MSVHELVIVADPNDEPRIALRCHAAPDAPCRRRPPDWETRDGGWTDEESTEPGHPCWAVEWVEACGLEALVFEGDDLTDLAPGVPIDISYDECVTWSVAEPEATDAEIEAAAMALHADECAEDPDPGEPCTCDSAYYQRMARIALNASREVAGR